MTFGKTRLELVHLLLLGVTTSAGALELPFDLAPVEFHQVPETLVLDGTVEAVSRSTVSAQTSGQIEEIGYDVDDYVPKGAVILRIRDTRQRAAVSQAKAALSEAQARRREAHSEHGRLSKVYVKGLVSKAELDRVAAALEAADARLESAHARLDDAEEQLTHTVVRAPYSGIVIGRRVEVGETVNPGTPLITGLSLERLRVVVNVPQRQIEAVRAGASAEVILSNGVVEKSDDLVFFPYADPSSNTFKVRVNLTTGVSGLFPGMFAKVAFIVGETERLLVPLGAVVRRSELTGVYVIDRKGRASLRQVRLGRRIDRRMEVLAGLEPGERVALDTVAAGIYLKSGRAGR
jgi:RND family efflux transporter MFP subunit